MNEEILLEELLISWQGSEEHSGPRTRDRKCDMVGPLLTHAAGAQGQAVCSQAGGREEEVAALVNAYSPPSDAC